MSRNRLTRLSVAIAAALAIASQGACAASAATALVQVHPASPDPYASSELLLAEARAGDRIVAVGDDGIVLLSDDAGRSWRQARHVPTNAPLTSVTFVDAHTGWAAGHWGTILHTTDGGETWDMQHSDPTRDRPFFSIRFSDGNHGIAGGLWSMLLRTDDGGRTWTPVVVPRPPDGSRADKNLFSIFLSGKGTWLIALEHGLVLRSTDQGATWSYVDTGYRGSLWTGLALQDGGLLVGGLRGSLYRSDDDGLSWHAAPTGVHSSVTGIAQRGSDVVAVCLDGVILRSADGGHSFTASQRPDRLAMTSVVFDGAREVMLSKSGVVNDTRAVHP
jgi:photosystem II stability/assembly factor-like uncharacterized protein